MLAKLWMFLSASSCEILEDFFYNKTFRLQTVKNILGWLMTTSDQSLAEVTLNKAMDQVCYIIIRLNKANRKWNCRHISKLETVLHLENLNIQNWSRRQRSIKHGRSRSAYNFPFSSHNQSQRSWQTPCTVLSGSRTQSRASIEYCSGPTPRPSDRCPEWTDCTCPK